tara:strand:+ start:7994 stop:9898 length:1905 start_codon:yes stop_codon:yes gene_type:complete
MADKKPIRTVFNDSNVATGLAEFQTGETIGLAHGGIGAALTIGSAGQVLKVNSGASALEFGSIEAIVNIDGATNLESATLAAGDKLLLSDDGTEGRVLLSQLDTLFSGTTKTLTNKSINASNNTLSNVTNSMLSGSAGITNANLANSAVTVGSTSIALGASATTIAGVTNITAGSINIAGNVIKSTDSTQVEIGAGDGLSVAGNLTVAGTMTVSGGVTSLETTNSTVSDKLIELATGTTGTPSGDVGLVFERGSAANAFIGFDESADEFTVGTGTFTGSTTGNLAITKGTLSSAGNKIYKAGTELAVSLVASSSLAGNVTLTLPINDGDANQLLSTDGSGNLSFISATAASGAGLSDLSDDSTPSLGGNLDMNGSDIITLSNANIDLLPHGTGKIIMDGNGTAGGVLVSDGLIEVKTGTGNVAKIQFYCETGNAHAQTLQAAPHSAGSSAVLTLPTATGTLIATGDTGTVTNTMLAGSIVNAKLAKSTITIQDDSSTQDAVALGETLIFEGGSGVTTTVTDNKVSIATDGSIVTESSTDTLTNKTLTTPVIASLKPNGSTTLTMPAATDTLVGKATTDTLTNKTLTSPKVNENVAVTATATQLNHSVGVTSAIQTQLDTKAAKSFAIAQAVALG